MSGLLCFSRNRCTGVEQVDEHTLRAYCRLQDTLTEAFVEITVQLPDLEIVAIKGDVPRSRVETSFDEIESLQKVVGVRVGPGMKKIFKGLLGESPAIKQLAFMVEECCHGVILVFTKESLKDAPEDEEGKRTFYSSLVRKNMRLFNRCAAYAPGSSLVEGIVPGQGM